MTGFRRSAPISAASFLFILFGLGFGLATPIVLAYIIYNGHAPIVFGIKLLDVGHSVIGVFGLDAVIGLGLVLTLVAALGVVAGFWLRRSLKKGGRLGMILLALNLFFAVGFEIPVLYVFVPLMAILLTLGWKSLRSAYVNVPTKRSPPITIASVLFLFLGLGIAVANPPLLAYITYYHTAPILPLIGNVLDDSTPIGMLLGLNGVIALGIVQITVSILGAVAGFWLWQSHKKGAILGIALLPVDLFFAYGFGIPILYIVPPLRSILLALGWGSLH